MVVGTSESREESGPVADSNFTTEIVTIPSKSLQDQAIQEYGLAQEDGSLEEREPHLCGAMDHLEVLLTAAHYSCVGWNIPILLTTMTSPQAWVEGNIHSEGARETPEDDREKAFSEFFSELELEEEVEEMTGEEQSKLVVVAVHQQEHAHRDYVAEVSVSTQSHILGHDDDKVAVPKQDEVCHDPDHRGSLLPTLDDPLDNDTAKADVPKLEEINHSVDNQVGVARTQDDAHDDIDADLAALRDGDTYEDDASGAGAPKQEDDDDSIEPNADILRREYLYAHILEAAIPDQEDVDQDLDDMLAALRQGLTHDDGSMDVAEPKQTDVNQDLDREADVNHDHCIQHEAHRDEINDTAVALTAVVSRSVNNEATVLWQGRSNHDNAYENVSEDAINAVAVFMSEDSDHPEPTPATTTILSTPNQEATGLADTSQRADAFVESNGDDNAKSRIDSDTRGSTEDDCRDARVEESTMSEGMVEPSHDGHDDNQDVATVLQKEDDVHLLERHGHDDEHDVVAVPQKEDDVHLLVDGHDDEHDVASVPQKTQVQVLVVVDDNENDAVALRGQDDVDHHHDNGEAAVFLPEVLPSDDGDKVPTVNQAAFEDDNEEITEQKEEYVNHDGDDVVTRLVGQDHDNDVITTRQEVFDVDEETDFPEIGAYIDDNEVYLGRKEQQRCQVPSCAIM